ncbi:hypothetical protein LXL04_032260 [Taraxacum kok-saghyz]
MSPSTKPLFFLVNSSLLLTTSLVHGTHLPDSDLILSYCPIALYPRLCATTLSAAKPENLATIKDVIEFTITKTKKTIQDNFHTINDLTTTTTNLTKREKNVLHDCLQLAAGTQEALDKVIGNLREYPAKKSLRKYADDLKTLMSTTITNKETCLDGFSRDADSKRLRDSIAGGQEHGGKMCSNALAMIVNMTETDMDMANEAELGIQEVTMWPEWLSAVDRKLMESEEVMPDATVAADGSGDYTTVGAAVAAAPSKSKSRYVIKIAAGVYRENVEIPRSKTNIMFIGDGRSTTIITGYRSSVGGSTTFDSATVAALGDGFLARDITIQNTAGPSGEHAVALCVGSDLSAFYKCNLLAYQDTLYAHSNRQFFVDCKIVGTVDYIFGNSAVVFQYCDIQIRRPNPNQENFITAQGRTDPNQNTGSVFQKCTITATSDLQPVQASFPTYLGRPWKEYSRVVVMQSSISDVIDPAGWAPWDGDFALDTLYYREYENTGPGADTSKRVTWKGWGVITDPKEAEYFTPGSFIAGGWWLGSTGFPFSLGL